MFEDSTRHFTVEKLLSLASLCTLASCPLSASPMSRLSGLALRGGLV